MKKANPSLRRRLARNAVERNYFSLRTNPPSKRMVLENLVIHLCEEPKAVTSEWQEELVL